MSIRRHPPTTEAGRQQSPRHFRSLNEALQNGQIGRGGEVRSYRPNTATESGLEWSEMARIGNSQTRRPERRRPR